MRAVRSSWRRIPQRKCCCPGVCTEATGGTHKSPEYPIAEAMAASSAWHPCPSAASALQQESPVGRMQGPAASKYAALKASKHAWPVRAAGGGVMEALSIEVTACMPLLEVTACGGRA